MPTVERVHRAESGDEGLKRAPYYYAIVGNADRWTLFTIHLPTPDYVQPSTFFLEAGYIRLRSFCSVAYRELDERLPFF